MFLAVAAVSLALGIGANTAIFSFVESTLLRGLPYPRAEELVRVQEHQPNFSVASLSPGEYLDYQKETRTLSGLAAWTFPQLTLTGAGEPLKLKGVSVTYNFFDVLGAHAELGRLLSSKIDRPGSGIRVAVISDDLWRSVFGSDPKIVGRDIALNNQKFRVVGVLGAEQAFPSGDQVWVSPRLDIPEYQENENPNVSAIYENHWLVGLGRLKPGMTEGQAGAELQSIAASIGRQHPDARGSFAILFPLQDWLVAGVRPSLMILLVAVVFLLLIACANLAGLLLARATGRTRELAIRFALGAARWEVVRLVLAESLLLATVGGTLGVAFATLGIRLLVHFSPYDLPTALLPSLNAPVLAFCFGVTLASALLSGWIPAFQSARVNANNSLKEGSKGSRSGRSHRLRRLLVSVQIAISVILLIGAGLLIRSFSKVIDVNPGFDATRVMTAQISLPDTRYQAGAAGLFWKKLLSRLNSEVSGESAGLMVTLPLSGQHSGGSIQAEGGRAVPENEAPYANWNVISPKTFSVLRVPLLAGRVFDEHDRGTSLHVAIVNKIFADRVFPHENPIGKRIKGGISGDWTTIVGVVGDVKYDSLSEKPELELYYDYTQVDPNFSSVVMRSNANDSVSISDLRHVVHLLDASIPLANVKPLSDYLDNALSSRKFLLGLLTSLSGLALLLAAIGIYAVLAHSVEQRRQEIGIRTALGATRLDVLSMILEECLAMAVAGAVMGLLGAVWATSFLKSLLYGVSTTDLPLYLVAAFVILIIAVAAALAPALRATRIDPISALRYE